MLKRKGFLILILTVALTGTFITQTSLHAQEAPTAAGAHAPKKREALALLRQAGTNALDIKNHFQHDLLLDQIGVAQAKAGDLEAAIETANAANFSPHETLDEIGRQLAKTNDLSRAEALGRKLKEGGLAAILANLVDAQTKLGQIAGAFRSAQLISNKEIRSYALEKIATRQAIDDDYAGARKTLLLARETYPAGLLNADDLEMLIVGAQVSDGETSAARERIEAVKSRETQIFLMIGVADELWKKGDHVAADMWLEDAFKKLPTGSELDFVRYFAIPIQVRLGRKEAALLAAGALTPELRVKGYMAIAVTCAEMKDVGGVEAAVDKMGSVVSVEPKGGVSDFSLKMMILNVTSALIDNGQFSEAAHLLDTLKEQVDNASYQMGIEPRLQLQRVLLLARKKQFGAARSLALKMRLNSITDVDRGKALRITALLQTKRDGISQTLPWARALADIEDRSYALLGIAQALLEIDDLKLGYSAIMVH